MPVALGFGIATPEQAAAAAARRRRRRDRRHAPRARRGGGRRPGRRGRRARRGACRRAHPLGCARSMGLVLATTFGLDRLDRPVGDRLQVARRASSITTADHHARRHRPDPQPVPARPGVAAPMRCGLRAAIACVLGVARARRSRWPAAATTTTTAGRRSGSRHAHDLLEPAAAAAPTATRSRDMVNAIKLALAGGRRQGRRR